MASRGAKQQRRAKPTTPYLPLFDAVASEAAKVEGMQRAAENPDRKVLLALAREIAVEIALGREDRCCTADDVQFELHKRGYSVYALGNAAGSIFKGQGKRWHFTGQRVESVREHAHSNSLRVWRYQG